MLSLQLKRTNVRVYSRKYLCAIILANCLVLMLSGCFDGTRRLEVITPSVFPSPPAIHFIVQVRSQVTGEPIVGGRILIRVAEQTPINAFTDSEGVARILVDSNYEGQLGYLIVEAPGYERYIRNINLADESLPNIILLKRETSPAFSSPISEPTTGTTPTKLPSPTITEELAMATDTLSPNTPSPTVTEELAIATDTPTPIAPPAPIAKEALVIYVQSEGVEHSLGLALSNGERLEPQLHRFAAAPALVAGWLTNSIFRRGRDRYFGRGLRAGNGHVAGRCKGW